MQVEGILDLKSGMPKEMALKWDDEDNFAVSYFLSSGERNIMTFKTKKEAEEFSANAKFYSNFNKKTGVFE